MTLVAEFIAPRHAGENYYPFLPIREKKILNFNHLPNDCYGEEIDLFEDISEQSFFSWGSFEAQCGGIYAGM